MGRILASIVLILGLAAFPVQAVDVPTLYTAKVPYDRAADDAEKNAYLAALVEVLRRVSGNELANDRAMIEALFPRPEAYVTQFQPASDSTLMVSFDGDAIEAILRREGQSVWGGDRPLTMVWLAVDWGGGDREILGAGEEERSEMQSRSIDRNRQLRERILRIAEDRGLPVAFPLLDTTDLQSVKFSDIWGGFDDRVVAASRRYETNSILIGRIRPSSSRENRWTYHFADSERSYTGNAEQVVGVIADRLATEFAVGGNAPLERVALSIGGIESVDAFGSVQRTLARLDVIEALHINQVSGDTINYQVDVRGGAERLARALRFAGLVEQESIGSVRSTDMLQFFFNP